MRLTDAVVVYNATHNDSVKHLWRKGRAHQALCGDPLQPWGQMRRVEGFEQDKDSPAATCIECLIRQAAMIATLAHANQYDLDGRLHIEHVRRVAEAVEHDRVAVIVALLHDVVVDSSLTARRLREEHFPMVVVNAVERLTREKNISTTAYLDRLCSVPNGESGRLSRLVLLAHACDNLARSRASGDARGFGRYERYVDRIARSMLNYGEITQEAFEAMLV